MKKAGTNSLYDGMAEIISVLKSGRSHSDIRELQTPHPLQSLFAFAADWAFISLAIVIFLIKPFPLIFISLLLIGSRQRALSNLVHDASHGNLFLDKNAGDIIANCLAALPLFDTVKCYRVSHLNHHRFLGSSERDPDSKSHLRYGYDDRNPIKGSALKAYLSILLNRRALADSLVGGLTSLSQNEIVLVVTWWIGVVAILKLVFGGYLAATFPLLWFFARMTTYHAIRIFAEFLDHSGLPSGSIIGFTRNLPHAGITRLLFHPHEDTFHLIHHLLPKVPHYKLRKLDGVLAGAKAYGSAHHCDSYFLGEHSAIHCWMGRCNGGRS